MYQLRNDILLNKLLINNYLLQENVGSTSKADDGVKLKADDIRRIKLERNKENSQSANNILPHKSKRLAEDIDKVCIYVFLCTVIAVFLHYEKLLLKQTDP